MSSMLEYRPGSLVRARGREWVVLPESTGEVLHLRPLGGSDDDRTVIYTAIESEHPEHAIFPSPDPDKAGNQEGMRLLRDSLKLKLRAGAGPFRSFGNLAVEPRAYQLVPLLMALKMPVVRLLIADDVGIGKTIESLLIARELLDRGEISRLAVICPPHLCDQWRRELHSKFNLQAEIVRTGTAARLERGLPAGQSIFDVYPFTVVSLDYIKSDRRLDDFSIRCPEFVIIEEAHTCVQGTANQRHQRYKLLRRLAQDPQRHLVLLTATPHSGDEEAFYSLLGCLDQKFESLRDVSGPQRESLREQLALHFVQRRRPDIAEWKDSTIFPDRESKETAYELTGEWGQLFEDILSYARRIVRSAEGKQLLQQRMSWWAALALLRCISSSPAAATNALKTRLQAAARSSEEEELTELDDLGCETVLDGESADILSADDIEPGARLEAFEQDPTEAGVLAELITRTQSLRGTTNDPKLKSLIIELQSLNKQKFSTVIFCRYIATAAYLEEHLRQAFSKDGYTVLAVTGELSSDEREEKIRLLADEQKRILVATDCLSEGVNLQDAFDAVVHYDLSWNPTRHEQREGRVDRFGQASKTVRALMLYGANNPVDGAVLQVILRKAERIRKELGVSVPMPEDSNKVMQAVMESVLLKGGATASDTQQLKIQLNLLDLNVEEAWQSAKEKAKQSQTIFAQRRLRPDQVLPEWQKTISVFGGEDEVKRFLTVALQRLGAALEPQQGFFRVPITHLAAPIRDQLEAFGIDTTKFLKVNFGSRPISGAEHIHRTHPIVSTIADYIAERALAEDVPELSARCACIFTTSVQLRTIVYVLRLRAQITSRTKADEKVLLAEESISVIHEGSDSPKYIDDIRARELFSIEASRNMEPMFRRKQIQQALEKLPSLQQDIASIAQIRAEELLADHRRVREASDGRGLRYQIQPCLPPDVVGILILIPDKTL